jgi:DNA repair protein RecO (recombination protein O)
MPTISDEALVLDAHAFRDRHQVVVLLTRSSGVLRAVLRGARGGKTPKRASTQVLSRVRIVAFQGPHAELATLREIEVLSSSYRLAHTMQAMAAAAVVAELLAAFFPAGEPAERAFRLGAAVLEALLAGTEPDLVVAYAELWILMLSGLMPPLGSCAGCGGPLTGQTLLRDGDGHPLCPSCAPPEAEVLEPGDLAQLAAFRRSAPTELQGTLSGACIRWLDRLVRIDADRRLKALEFLRRSAG